ncbi:MAG: hypothetical protein D6795_02420 [Deltaproteobacteria bacterium]|nr:MAG: hypothetical protein D6795_02420 [Deltaproteobacteria bacterium]
MAISPETEVEEAMSKFICPVCERAVDDVIIPFHKNVERQILALIQRHNPRWVEPDGSCPKCIEYYKALIANRRIDALPPEGRQEER